jgi:hypothetical protein
MMMIIDNDYNEDDDVYNDSAGDDAGDDGWMMVPHIGYKVSHNTSHSIITLTLLFNSLI